MITIFLKQKFSFAALFSLLLISACGQNDSGKSQRYQNSQKQNVTQNPGSNTTSTTTPAPTNTSDVTSNAASEGFLQGNTLVILNGHWGTAEGDAFMKDDTYQFGEVFKSQGYQVVDASLKKGETLTSFIKSSNFSSKRFIILIAGHGSTESNINGISNKRHIISESSTNSNRATIVTKEEVMIPFINNLGVAPSNILFIIESCFSGQTVNDFQGDPSAPIILPTSNAYYGTSGWEQGTSTSNVLTSFAKMLPKNSASRQAADINKDGKIQLGEFRTYINNAKLPTIPFGYPDPENLTDNKLRIALQTIFTQGNDNFEIISNQQSNPTSLDQVTLESFESLKQSFSQDGIIVEVMDFPEAHSNQAPDMSMSNQ